MIGHAMSQLNLLPAVTDDWETCRETLSLISLLAVSSGDKFCKSGKDGTERVGGANSMGLTWERLWVALGGPFLSSYGQLYSWSLFCHTDTEDSTDNQENAVRFTADLWSRHHLQALYSILCVWFTVVHLVIYCSILGGILWCILCMWSTMWWYVYDVW